MRKVLIGALVCAFVSGCGGQSAPQTSLSHATPSATSLAQSVTESLSVATSTGPTAPIPSIASLTVLSTNGEGLSSKTMESGFGSVWALTSGGLSKVSEAGAVTNAASGNFLDVAIGAKSVYALQGGSVNELDELDPSSGKQLHKWTLDPGAHSLAVTGDAAYVIHGSYPAVIDRIALATGRSKSVTVNELSGGVLTGHALAAGGGLIWASSDGTTIYGLDPTTLSVKVTAHVPTSATSLWFGLDSLWTSSDGYHVGIHRVDPATGQDVADVRYDAIQMTFSTNAAWASAYDGPSQLDPESAAVVAVVPRDQAPSNYSAGIAVLNDKTFVSYADTGQLQTIAVP